MTTAEWINIIFNGLTSVGTVGAVALSLWFSRPNKTRFAIRDASILLEQTMDSHHKVVNKSYFLILKIENMLDAQMEIFSIRIEKDNKEQGLNAIVIPCERKFIPQKSIYEIRIKIPKDTQFTSLSKKPKFCITVISSFGDRRIPLPKKWLNRFIESQKSIPQETIPRKEAA